MTTRFDPKNEEVRALWETGWGGMYQCRLALRARNMRQFVEDAQSIEDLREILLVLLDQVHPADPGGGDG